ncbi:MAG TPA: alpha-amylase family glycosyl hydrolase [Vicinamibacterales bacterium]|nr:alpha-amylase family glycosyl hydrolase [Vicinamibacterales bacterium]
MRAHPHLYEISTWPYLERLSARAGRPITIGSVPDGEWDRLHSLGFDLVYLMGVWQRSTIGRQIARSEPALFSGYDSALPGWTLADIVGSPYSIAAYSPDPRIGTFGELDAVRRKLHRRGMGLVLDFVPNHTAFDHPWVTEHPQRYVIGSLERFRAQPRDFRLAETSAGPLFVACARDPYFPPWTDAAQLNYFSTETQDEMIAQLKRIARHCDGVRCDMAMLVLGDVFAGTWGQIAARDPAEAAAPRTEFWERLRQQLPGFLLIAEAYWDREWALQQLGFSFTYDKRLYDRLLHETPASVRDYLRANLDFQTRSVRFLENHDEPRSLAAFGPRLEAAAVVSGAVPGLRFYFDGQLEGRTRFSPIQLGHWAEEEPRTEVAALYARLLEATNHPVFHDGDWKLLHPSPAGDDTHTDIVSCRWKLGTELRIVAANLGHAGAQAFVPVADDLPARPPAPVLLEDALTGQRHRPDASSLQDRGLFVSLEGGRAQLFRVTPGGK